MSYWLAPKFFTDFRNDPRITQSQAVAIALEELQGYAREQATSPSASSGFTAVPVTVAINPLLNVLVTLSTPQRSPELHNLYASVRIRVDNLIFITGTWLVGTVAIAVLNQRPKFIKFGIDPTALPARIARGREASAQSVEISAEKFLAADVSAALDRAADLFSRSTLMLVAGVIMAFIGVGVFYVSLPQFQPGDDRWTYLERGIRPTGMLVFVEGIAWFLLSQYRALIEDYKTFHRMYLKRANYLVALKILSANEITPHQLFLVASMISEDLTGRLKAGETTENIEGVRLIEPNPIFVLFQSLVEAVTDKKDKR